MLEVSPDVADGLERMREAGVDPNKWVMDTLREALAVELEDFARIEDYVLPGWIPWALEDGSWGAAHHDPASLPAILKGRRIVVTTKKPRRKWTMRIVEVLERTPDVVVVRDTGLPRTAKRDRAPG
ncbi:MAG: hypothetical protein OXK20_03550 [Deltaproteobacteria bacterium]|nr:hypothetical protein [Deltaproteobacteria bacterium]